MPIKKQSSYALRKRGEYYVTVPASTMAMIDHPISLAILVYLLSKDESWEVRPGDIRERFDIGDYTWRKCAGELKEKGLLWLENIQDEAGKIVSRQLVVSATPVHDVDDQRDGPYRWPSTDISNNQGNTNINNNKTNTNKPKQDTKKLNNNFNKWYSVYPKKKNKPDALKAFTKLNPDDDLLDLMIADVQLRLERDDGWRELSYIPYPASYLRGEMWQDDIVPRREVKQKPVLPRDDTKLQQFAQSNNLPLARPGESFYEYRCRLSNMMQH